MIALDDINLAMLIGGLIAGCLCGLLPLRVGWKHQQKGLAVGGMMACLFTNLILTLELQNQGLLPTGTTSCLLTGFFVDLVLAGPVAIVFLLLVLGASASRATGERVWNRHRRRRAPDRASAREAGVRRA
jgi:hypothetical protein